MKKSIDKAALCMIYLLSNRDGVLAQLGEHLLCTQGVIGSIPIRSTMIDQKRFLTESFFVLIIFRKPHSLANRIRLFIISSYFLLYRLIYTILCLYIKHKYMLPHKPELNILHALTNMGSIPLHNNDSLLILDMIIHLFTGLFN